MKLSDTEKKMVVRLQRQQRSFVRSRWGILLSSIVCLGCGIYGMWISLQCIRPDVGAIVVLATVLTVACFMFAIGAWLMVYTFANWSGKPEVRLLLKLIEDLRDDA